MRSLRLSLARTSLPVGPDNLRRRVCPLVGGGRGKTEAAGELWPDRFACQGLPWIRECRELGLSVLVGAGVELPI